MDVRSLISRLLPPAAEAEDFRRRLFVLIATAAGIPTLLFFALYNIWFGTPVLSIVCAIGVILLSANQLFLFRPAFDRWAPRVVISYVCFLVAVNLLQDQSMKSMFWTLIIPPLTLFVFGAQEGVLWTGLFLVPVTIVVMHVQQLNPAAYPDVAFDFAFAYLNVFIISYGYETLRSRAQRESQDRAQRLSRFVDASSDYLYELDSELRFVYISPRWEQVTGIPISRIIGTTVEQQAPFFLSGDFDRNLKSVKAHEPVRDFRFSFVRSDGKQVYLLTRGDPYFDKEGNFLGYTGTGTDITAYEESQAAIREKEHQLAQSQKMESIGQLTSGIAHDFNNLLTVIMGYVDLLKLNASGDSRMLEALETAADRASQLTKRLLSFSRERTSHQEVANIGKLVNGLTTLLTRALGPRVTIHITAEGDDLIAVADVGQFESAILNLAINARDAMHDTGNLRIEARRVRLDDPANAGEYIQVSVSDDGSGIPADLIERVTEPFFSTKPQGQGTGLGLSMVKGFVTQSNGFMAIDSSPGRGTMVKLYFPASNSNGKPRSNTLAIPVDYPSRVAIVVEDDDDVARIIQAMLQSCGYTLRVCTEAEAALQIIDEVNPDVVVTDIVLKGRLSGAELAETLKAKYPGIGLVLMSGYPEVLSGALEETEVLQKPFTRADLLGAIEHVLSQPRGHFGSDDIGQGETLGVDD